MINIAKYSTEELKKKIVTRTDYVANIRENRNDYKNYKKKYFEETQSVRRAICHEKIRY